MSNTIIYHRMSQSLNTLLILFSWRALTQEMLTMILWRFSMATWLLISTLSRLSWTIWGPFLSALRLDFAPSFARDMRMAYFRLIVAPC